MPSLWHATYCSVNANAYKVCFGSSPTFFKTQSSGQPSGAEMRPVFTHCPHSSKPFRRRCRRRLGSSRARLCPPSGALSGCWYESIKKAPAPSLSCPSVRYTSTVPSSGDDAARFAARRFERLPGRFGRSTSFAAVWRWPATFARAAIGRAGRSLRSWRACCSVSMCRWRLTLRLRPTATSEEETEEEHERESMLCGMG